MRRIDRALLPNGDLTYRIVGPAMCVHGCLGPGLFESVYHRCHELVWAEVIFDQLVRLPIRYRDIPNEPDYLAYIVVRGGVRNSLPRNKSILCTSNIQYMIAERHAVTPMATVRQAGIGPATL